MVSRYCTALHVAVMLSDMQQFPSKGMKEEDCLLVNVNVNYAGFKLLRKIGFANVL